MPNRADWRCLYLSAHPSRRIYGNARIRCKHGRRGNSRRAQREDGANASGIVPSVQESIGFCGFRARSVRCVVVDWSAIQALKRENAAAALAKRHPSFYNRYAGKDDEFGFKLEVFAFWEFVLRFLCE